MTPTVHDEDSRELEAYTELELADGRRFEGLALSDPEKDSAWIFARKPMEIRQ